ncbi:unnamed protein product [Brassica napus]|uniref:(rape) hypothetical protein n=1 Tax=Brassica napus TaxID=3708 RepID=A0A816T3K2_BRANA|nr:unnamed protein product [Brassica napus]
MRCHPKRLYSKSYINMESYIVLDISFFFLPFALFTDSDILKKN